MGGGQQQHVTSREWARDGSHVHTIASHVTSGINSKCRGWHRRPPAPHRTAPHGRCSMPVHRTAIRSPLHCTHPPSIYSQPHHYSAPKIFFVPPARTETALLAQQCRAHRHGRRTHRALAVSGTPRGRAPDTLRTRLCQPALRDGGAVCCTIHQSGNALRCVARRMHRHCSAIALECGAPHHN